MKTWMIVGVVVVLIIAGFRLIGGEETVTSSTREPNLEDYETAVFAGGCFWCMEAGFEATEGVIEAVSGYTGGTTENPTYEQVSSGQTGHYEAVIVYYDPKKITYPELIQVFWRNINPTDTGGQFADRGTQYKTAIFYQNEEQRTAAQKAKSDLDNSDKFTSPIVTEILPFTKFYQAEEYHQDYYKKNVRLYNLYKKDSGREDYIKDTWKDPE